MKDEKKILSDEDINFKAHSILQEMRDEMPFKMSNEFYPYVISAMSVMAKWYRDNYSLAMCDSNVYQEMFTYVNDNIGNAYPPQIDEIFKIISTNNIEQAPNK